MPGIPVHEPSHGCQHEGFDNAAVVRSKRLGGSVQGTSGFQQKKLQRGIHVCATVSLGDSNCWLMSPSHPISRALLEPPTYL